MKLNWTTTERQAVGEEADHTKSWGATVGCDSEWKTWSFRGWVSTKSGYFNISADDFSKQELAESAAEIALNALLEAFK